jgi:hypothetical protein
VWSVRFTEAARAELIDAQDWYEAEAPGLARRFRAEIDSVVAERQKERIGVSAEGRKGEQLNADTPTRRHADTPTRFPSVPSSVSLTVS